MNLKEMTYTELGNKVIENRRQLRITKDPEEKRHLIRENHEMMVEMDRR